MAEYIINTDNIQGNCVYKRKVLALLGEPLKELILCRECRFWPDNQMMAIFPRKNGKTDQMIMMQYRCLYMGPEDYCSKAERRKHVE